jgi:3-hydroxyisobutyrate dehydrogenase-like beta-hydroxyacid dehydrogenase
MSDTRPIGLVGLGLVGKALIARLTAAGHCVLGYDTHEGAREQASALGVELAATAGEVGMRCDTILLSLPDSDTVNRVIADEQMGQRLHEGTLVLDTTTGCPSDAAHNSHRLIERGVRFIDVTLSGSSEDIARGEATALVGAEHDPQVAALVQCFADKTFFLGQPGAGCLAKLIVNHVMGLNRVALAEGLALGEKAGLPAAALLPILQASAAHSKVMDLKGRRMVEGRYNPASRIAQHAKDVRLVLKLGQDAGAYLPLEQVHLELLERAIAEGLGEQDNAAIIELFRERQPAPGKPL